MPPNCGSRGALSTNGRILHANAVRVLGSSFRSTVRIIAGLKIAHPNVRSWFSSTTQQAASWGCEQLGIEIICANSPQAKGRVERANGVLQDRLVKELRLQQISTIDAANLFAPAFIATYNARFAVAARSEIDADRRLEPQDDLDRILATAHTRVVSKNLTVQYGANIFEITEKALPQRLRSSQVEIREHRNGTITIERRGQKLAYRLVNKLTKQTRIVGAKELACEETPASNRRLPNPKKAHPFPSTHPWLHKRRRSSNQLEGDICIGPDGDIIAVH